MGYARSKLTIDDVKSSVKPFCKVHFYSEDFGTSFSVSFGFKLKTSDDEKSFDDFFSNSVYIAGTYDQLSSYEMLSSRLKELASSCDQVTNYIFYLAVPPSVFDKVTSNIKQCCMAPKLVQLIMFSVYIHVIHLVFSGYTRIVIEKPFGHDLESSNALSKHLASLFPEEKLYRIDHYLGKEMSQNMLVLRCGTQPASVIQSAQKRGIHVCFKVRKPTFFANLGQQISESRETDLQRTDWNERQRRVF